MRLAAGRSCSTLFSPAVHRAGHKKGAIGSERKKFSNVGGLRGRQKAPATCATAARCSPLSLSFSLRSLRLQRDQFRGKTRGAPSCNLRWYAPSNSRASVIPALSRFHVFVPWVLILSFFLFTRVRLMERFEARRVLENSISSQVKRII